MKIGIPKRLGHIWIGPKPAPTHWMNTWPEKHPDWDYRIYDNDFLREFPFRNRKLINEYFWRGEYAGVQDLMRYEILYEFGGFMADADAVCLHRVDPLLGKTGAYTVYDRPQEEGRGVSPFLACEPGNPLVGEVIERLSRLEPWDLRKPFHSTGNLFLMSVIRQWGEDGLTIFPSHYFIPWHHNNPEDVYTGPDKIYAEQKWGTATYSYNRGEGEGDEALTRNELTARAGTLRCDLIETVQTLGPAAPEGKMAGDPAVRRADANGDVLARVLADKAWGDHLAALNTALIESLEGRGLPVRFNGTGFYRHLQNQPLTESPLMTRAANFRARIAAYLAGARSVMQIGVDAGHMLLLQRLAAPSAEIVAVDAGHRMTPDSAPVEVYTPAAISWFRRTFPDEVAFLTGRPAIAIGRFLRSRPEHRVDLLHFNGIDLNFLKSYGAAIGALAEDGIVLIQDMNADAVRGRIEELQMIGEIALPVEYTDFGPGRGALAVFRRRREA